MIVKEEDPVALIRDPNYRKSFMGLMKQKRSMSLTASKIRTTGENSIVIK